MSDAFFDAISDYFLERTGRGLVLSSRDLELLIGWHDRGASAHSICRAIDGAVEQRDEMPRDLYSLRRPIENALDESTLAPAVTRTLPPPAPVEEDPLDGALVKLTEPAQRPEIGEAYALARARILEAQAADEDPWSILFEVESMLVRDVFARLGEDERRLIDIEVEGQHGPHLSMMNEEAREATFLEGRAALLRERWGLAALAD